MTAARKGRSNRPQQAGKPRSHFWRQRAGLLAVGGVIVAAILLEGALGPGGRIDLPTFGGASQDSVARGQELYATYCVTCHGIGGVGERPDDIYAQDAYGYVAPPLDGTGHAWHHTDPQLEETIMQGSPRNPRMVAWGSVFAEEDALAIVTYIKSLWSPYTRDNCQGPAHMNPGC